MNSFTRVIIYVSAFVLCTGLRWGQDRGGGDEIGLEFQKIAHATLADLKTHQPFLYEQLKNKNLESVIENLYVVTVDTPLKILVGTSYQDSVAVNDPKESLILVQRARWENVKDERIKAGIVLHEILSLVGIEETGFYPISSRYVTALGAPSDSIKTVKDQDHTYLSCLDTSSAALVFSITPDYLLKSEVRAFSNENLIALQSFALAWGIQDVSNIIGMTFDINTRIPRPGTWGLQDNLCRMDLYNRALIECSDTAFLGTKRTLTFKRANGSTLAIQAGTIDFEMSELLSSYQLKVVMPLPDILVPNQGFAATAFTFQFKQNSCR